jgi:hypothetical protein
MLIRIALQLGDLPPTAYAHKGPRVTMALFSKVLFHDRLGILDPVLDLL